MKISKNLAEYIKARHSNEWGWLPALESQWTDDNDSPERWARLCGLYANLLEEVLDMIPPCILKEMANPEDK